MQETPIDKEDLFTILTFQPNDDNKVFGPDEYAKDLYVVKSKLPNKWLIYNQHTNIWKYLQ